jgi:hypothetical protein
MIWILFWGIATGAGISFIEGIITQLDEKEQENDE